MASWEGLNRRKFPRVSYPCLIKIKDPEQTILTHTENLGIGGACVVIKHNLKIFTAVDVEIDLQDIGDHITCQAKVVWNVRRKATEEDKPMFYDIGLEFVDIDEDDRARIDIIVKKLVKMGKMV